MPEIDKDLAAAIKQAKKTRMRFAFVSKGPGDGKLLLALKGVPPEKVNRAKKETGGKKVYRGRCFGDDGTLVFEVAEPPPATLEKELRITIKENAGVLLKVEIRVVQDLVEDLLTDDSEPVEPVDVEESVDVVAPEMQRDSPVQNNPAADLKMDLLRRLEALKAEYNSVTKGKGANVDKLKAFKESCNALVVQKDYTGAAAVIDEMRQLIAIINAQQSYEIQLLFNKRDELKWKLDELSRHKYAQHIGSKILAIRNKLKEVDKAAFGDAQDAIVVVEKLCAAIPRMYESYQRVLDRKVEVDRKIAELDCHEYASNATATITELRNQSYAAARKAEPNDNDYKGALESLTAVETACAKFIAEFEVSDSALVPVSFVQAEQSFRSLGAQIDFESATVAPVANVEREVPLVDLVATAFGKSKQDVTDLMLQWVLQANPRLQSRAGDPWKLMVPAGTALVLTGCPSMLALQKEQAGHTACALEKALRSTELTDEQRERLANWLALAQARKEEIQRQESAAKILASLKPAAGANGPESLKKKLTEAIQLAHSSGKDKLADNLLETWIVNQGARLQSEMGEMRTLVETNQQAQALPILEKARENLAAMIALLKNSKDGQAQARLRALELQVLQLGEQRASLLVGGKDDSARRKALAEAGDAYRTHANSRSGEERDDLLARAALLDIQRLHLESVAKDADTRSVAKSAGAAFAVLGAAADRCASRLATAQRELSGLVEGSPEFEAKQTELASIQAQLDQAEQAAAGAAQVRIRCALSFPGLQTSIKDMGGPLSSEQLQSKDPQRYAQFDEARSELGWACNDIEERIKRQIAANKGTPLEEYYRKKLADANGTYYTGAAQMYATIGDNARQHTLLAQNAAAMLGGEPDPLFKADRTTYWDGGEYDVSGYFDVGELQADELTPAKITKISESYQTLKGDARTAFVDSLIQAMQVPATGDNAGPETQSRLRRLQQVLQALAEVPGEGQDVVKVKATLAEAGFQAAMQHFDDAGKGKRARGTMQACQDAFEAALKLQPLQVELVLQAMFSLAASAKPAIAAAQSNDEKKNLLDMLTDARKRMNARLTGDKTPGPELRAQLLLQEANAAFEAGEINLAADCLKQLAEAPEFQEIAWVKKATDKRISETEGKVAWAQQLLRELNGESMAEAMAYGAGGATLGAGIGFLLGGPVGAAIGALIGGAVGTATLKVVNAYRGWDHVKQAWDQEMCGLTAIDTVMDSVCLGLDVVTSVAPIKGGNVVGSQGLKMAFREGVEELGGTLAKTVSKEIADITAKTGAALTADQARELTRRIIAREFATATTKFGAGITSVAGVSMLTATFGTSAVSIMMMPDGPEKQMAWGRLMDQLSSAAMMMALNAGIGKLSGKLVENATPEKLARQIDELLLQSKPNKGGGAKFDDEAPGNPGDANRYHENLVDVKQNKALGWIDLSKSEYLDRFLKQVNEEGFTTTTKQDHAYATKEELTDFVAKMKDQGIIVLPRKTNEKNKNTGQFIPVSDGTKQALFIFLPNPAPKHVIRAETFHAWHWKNFLDKWQKANTRPGDEVDMDKAIRDYGRNINLTEVLEKKFVERGDTALPGGLDHAAIKGKWTAADLKEIADGKAGYLVAMMTDLKKKETGKVIDAIHADVIALCKAEYPDRWQAALRDWKNWEKAAQKHQADIDRIKQDFDGQWDAKMTTFDGTFKDFFDVRKYSISGGNK